MQPGYGWPDHRAHHDGDKQDENDLVEPVKKPEAKNDKNEDESRPHDALKCPLMRLRRWMECHACPTLYECLSAKLYVLNAYSNAPSRWRRGTVPARAQA